MALAWLMGLAGLVILYYVIRAASILDAGRRRQRTEAKQRRMDGG